MPMGDLFGPDEVSFVLEGFDADGQQGKVAETASSPVTDPTTGEVRMEPGKSLKVPVKIKEGFNGRIELKAVDPQTGAILATLSLSTDFHH